MTDSQIGDSSETYNTMLMQLDYKSSSNFISTETPEEQISSEREMTWREAKDKLGIDAIYFVANAPIIYFKRFDAPDKERIARLHQNVWSQSKVPLLFVVLPGDVRIYSGYEAPKYNKSKVFIEPSRLDEKLTADSTNNIWERLSVFTRVAIETGSFWREHNEYLKRRTKRADQTLVKNLRYIRRKLMDAFSQQIIKFYKLDKNQDKQRIKELSARLANSLIGRSLFAIYLQDRGVLNNEKGNFFTERFGPSYSRYTDLLKSYEQTYEFFDFLHERFNGDIFPILEEEKNVIVAENLHMLQRLFTETSVGVKGDRQLLFFWAYNFEFIPIDLISSIYEEFLHEDSSNDDNSDIDGIYYTPPRLVDFMLEQVLPEGDTNYQLRILDPACGSGIFLVEAYRRLIARWYAAHKRTPTFRELVDVLHSFIFGVDIKSEALSIASFSLCLALSDYLGPEVIWQDVKFPSLIKDGNLVHADFFQKDAQFSELKFDLIVGNPPWNSELTIHAETFLREHGYDVGDKQIAQAFLWHAPDFCNAEGQVALLCSSKNLLFNRSGPNNAFRQQFFRQFAVTQIFDFSALRRYLFDKATHPSVAIFYNAQRPDLSATIFYGAPKLTHLTRRFTELVIEANDLKYLPLEQVLESIDNLESESQGDDEVGEFKQHELFAEDVEQSKGQLPKKTVNIWKVALWGTNYDYILLQHLNKFPSLEQIIQERQWVSKVGFNRKGPGKPEPAAWLDGKLYLEPKYFARYGVQLSRLATLQTGNLYYRRGIPEQFKSPFVLFKRTQVARQIAAAFFDTACAYSETFVCIAGSEQESNLLKAVTALLNSKLAQYYFFLTSASWGVEREEIKPAEMKALPYPFKDMDNENILEIASLTDDLISSSSFSENEMRQKEGELDKIIYRCFQLSEQEILHIEETIEYTVKFFHAFEKSSALDKPSDEMKISYARAYMEALNFYLSAVDRKLSSTVYFNERTPWLALKFSLHFLEDKIEDIRMEQPGDTMKQVLSQLDRLSIEQVSGRAYQRRNFRIYENSDEDTLYRIKPAERRQWTIGAALSDAEETISDLM